MEVLQLFINNVFDATKSLLSRIIIFISFVCVIWFVDSYFQFSFNYRLNSKIEQIKNIESVIKETDDITLKKSLKNAEKNIVNSINLGNYFSSFLALNANRIYSISKSIAIAISANPIFHYLFSNTFLIVFMLWYIRFGVDSGNFLTALVSVILVVCFLFIVVFWVSGSLAVIIMQVTDNDFFKFLLMLLSQPIIMCLLYLTNTFRKFLTSILNERKNLFNHR